MQPDEHSFAQQTVYPDLSEATAVVSDVVRAVRDEHLAVQTPCAGWSVATVLDHLAGLSIAFTDAARGDLEAGNRAPSPDATHLDPRFRSSTPVALAALAAAWRDPSAWSGMTRAGGVDLPGEVAGLVALNEVVVHGWDLAAASGQTYQPPVAAVEAALPFVTASVQENPEGTPGLFQAPLLVPDGARPLERLLRLTGRDPGWRPGP